MPHTQKSFSACLCYVVTACLVYVFVACVCLFRLKPKSFDLKIQVFGSEYEILNVDSEEYSYICFIKYMKHCVVDENEVVQLYPDEEFKVEVELTLSRAIYLLNEDNYMNFIFQEYEIKCMRKIRVYVEVKPLEGLLEAPNQCENDSGSESPVRQTTDLDEGGVANELYSSDVSDDDRDNEVGQGGNWC
ncbi:hypothetical protein Pint_02548 [Pistacia integerrima]|uniref:Uncharacterized protein n=1 Tax=Pistacia integerrima TaxID=434235 RepID=A0ACC0ZLL2_9ROSI|nr:hypothetical protein Pint_02548 [Pistacia integerrima]